MGYLNNELPAKDKPELLELIEGISAGVVAAEVPPRLLQHHLRRHPVPEWVHQQVYLNPYPKELMLRNRV
jgi:uncharacterized protein YbgA (DUF1722 family)